MKFYQVAITGIVQVGEGEPSPITWAWSPGIIEDMEHIDIEFREMILAPQTDDFTREATNAEFKEHLLSTGMMVGNHQSDCKWPDDGCPCQG